MAVSSFESVIANPRSVRSIRTHLWGELLWRKTCGACSRTFANSGGILANAKAICAFTRIDFADVKGIFDGYTFIRRSDRYGEVRYQIFGFVHGRKVAVACTLRGEQCWIISARRAHRGEREKYYGGLAGRSPTGED